MEAQSLPLIDLVQFTEDLTEYNKIMSTPPTPTR